MRYTFYLHHFSRNTDWRSRLVRELVRSGAPLDRAQSDEPMCAYFRFLTRPRSVNRLLRSRISPNGDFALEYAHDIFTDGKSYGIRFAIETRLLAGESDRTIAKKIGTSPKVIYWYEALFYSVRDRLGATDYVVKMMNRERGRAYARDDDHKLKILAYFGGPVVADDILGHGINGADAGADVSSYYDTGQRKKLGRAALMAGMDRQMTPADARRLIQMHLRLMGAEGRRSKKRDELSQAFEAVDALIDGLSDTINLRSPGKSKKSEDRPAKRKKDTKAAG